MYQFIEKLHTLYGLLQDEQSKEIFQARFTLEMEDSTPNVRRLALLSRWKELSFMGWLQQQKEVLKQLNRENKKIVLYGTTFTGQFIAEMLQSEHITFYGFCGRGAKKFPDGLLGKPVIGPDELLAHMDEYYIIPAVSPATYPEISGFLRKHNYPEEHILDGVDSFTIGWGKRQYFDFPELYRRGTAFIDGGCYDCETSRIFAEWCGGAYSSIIAFEPDPGNYAKCCKYVQDVPIPNFQLVNAGLSSQGGMAVFDAQNSGSSRIISSNSNEVKTNMTGNKISVRTVAIDDIVGDRTVGFIKMDIEGSEFDALHGAKNTILRDKPLLAICVYHRKGDLFAIMDYLHQLLPEYRFLLRQYTNGAGETVLYASVDL